MAHIVITKNREGKEYVYLRQSFRKGDKVIHKNLKSYGKLEDLKKDDPRILEKLQEEAKNIDNDSTIYTIKLSSGLKPTVIGKNYSWKILEKIYNELNIHNVCNSLQNSSKIKFDIDKIFKLLVFARILNPCSKIKTLEFQNSLFGEWKFNENQMYRSLNYILEMCEDLQLTMHEAITKNIGRQATLVFYDVTNYYFETDLDDEIKYAMKGKELTKSMIKRMKGPSKEKRDNPIVQLGLFMDSNGIPISYKLFSGNVVDTSTYTDAIEQVKKQFGIERIVVVADKAMNSTKNVSKNSENNDGWLFSSKIRGTRGTPKKLQSFALSSEGWEFNADRTFGKKSMIRERKLSDGTKIKEKVLVSWSKEYADREKMKRIQVIEYLNSLTDEAKYNASNKKGCKKYLNATEVDENTGEVIKTKTIVTLNKERIEFDAKFDGLNVLVTSELDMSDEKMLEAYHSLSKIEDCFKVTKSQLDARPVFVWTEKHIQAHFLICFVSLVLMRVLEHKIENVMSVQRIQEALKSCTCREYNKGIYVIEHNDEASILLNKTGIKGLESVMPHPKFIKAIK